MSRRLFQVMAKTFYIFRHGATFATISGTSYGDQILTASIAQGSQAVLTRIGEYFMNIDTDVNISSPLLRCRQTAKIVGKVAGKKFIYDERISEFATTANDFLTEPLEAFKKRLLDLLTDINKNDFNSVLICTHGAVISGLINLIKKGDFNLEEISAYPDTGVLVIINGKEVSEINFN